MKKMSQDGIRLILPVGLRKRIGVKIVNAIWASGRQDNSYRIRYDDGKIEIYSLSGDYWALTGEYFE